ncbi:MAG: SurA N-terminal domain-containing protein [Aquificota bacterium]|nr:SurA N-terminal domain-containing protein [Aquificota bacterium]
MYSLIQRHKRLAAFIIALASISFLFWMFTVADIKQMFGKGGCVAVVNGECVDLREFRYEILKYADILGDPDVERVVKRRVVSDLVVREVLFQKAEDMGILASYGEVAETIKTDRAFWENGSFSIEKYREVLSRFGITPQEYEEHVRRMITIDRLFRFLRAGVYMTEEEIHTFSRIEGVRFKGRVYLITEDYVKITEKPSEEEMRSFYERNRERFSLPEVKVFRVWTTEEKKEAHSVYRSLKEGKTVKGGVSYRVSSKQRPELPAEVVREMERIKREGGYSITKAGNTYYIIYLEKVHPKGYKSFSEVRSQIEKELIEEKKREKLREFAEGVKRRLKEGKGAGVRYLRFENSGVEDLTKTFSIREGDIMKMVFSKERVFGPYSMRTGFAVLEIEGRSFEDEKGDGLKEDLFSQKVGNILDLFVESLVRKSRIDINEDMLN